MALSGPSNAVKLWNFNVKLIDKTKIKEDKVIPNVNWSERGNSMIFFIVLYSLLIDLDPDQRNEER